MKITRRAWAGALAIAVTRGDERKSEAPEALKRAASERRRRDIEVLAKFPLPMEVEPAFSFKV